MQASWIRLARFCFGFAASSVVCITVVFAAEPPALNPFGPAVSQGEPERDDALPGCLELSDGSLHPGMIYLTRDKRLSVYDERLQRQREVPLQTVKQIECKVKKEWMEKEWKFKETTSDEKILTGRSYPAREYVHTITLRDGRTITGPLSAIVYVRPSPQQECRAVPIEQTQQGGSGKDAQVVGLRQADQIGRRCAGGWEEKAQTGGAARCEAANGFNPPPLAPDP